jgi:hypothetical protein
MNAILTVHSEQGFYDFYTEHAPITMDCLPVSSGNDGVCLFPSFLTSFCSPDRVSRNSDFVQNGKTPPQD